MTELMCCAALVFMFGLFMSNEDYKIEHPCLRRSATRWRDRISGTSRSITLESVM